MCMLLSIYKYGHMCTTCMTLSTSRVIYTYICKYTCKHNYVANYMYGHMCIYMYTCV